MFSTYLVELEQMLEKEGLSLDNIPSSTFSQPWLSEVDCEITPEIYGHIGSGSGGYCDHIFKLAAAELFGHDCEKLEYKNLRYEHFFLKRNLVILSVQFPSEILTLEK